MVDCEEQREIEKFIKDFVDEIQQGNAAIFAGAGLSVAAGFVNWHELLSPIMKDLGLNPEIEKETDLVAVAQYYCNKTRSRNRLNQLIINKLSDCTEPTCNHKILARLPINTYWTTNYDKLIEKALEQVGKILDVKYTTKHLTSTKKMCNAVVYKMHGDVDHPHDAILTKDDYDQYYIKCGKFIDLLTCDLMSKTFLFIGFSFTDPNIDYVLSRVRSVFNENQRQHYCFLKTRSKQDDESEDKFKNDQIKQQLAIEDLKRFNITTLLIDDYSEITDILKRIELQFRQRTIFISGSAEEYGDNWTKQKAEEFLCDLSRNLIKKDFRIVTGFGLGVGDFIIVGAVKEIYRNKGRIEDSLIIRPFPQETSNKEELLRFYEGYRQEFISTAGICLVVFGNKKDNNKTVFLNEKKYNGSNCETDLSSGVQREFEIAKEKGLKIVPIGATGYMAEKIWEEVMSNFDKYYPNSNQDLKEKFNKLKDREQPSELINSTLEFIASITNH